MSRGHGGGEGMKKHLAGRWAVGSWRGGFELSSMGQSIQLAQWKQPGPAGEHQPALAPRIEEIGMNEVRRCQTGAKAPAKAPIYGCDGRGPGAPALSPGDQRIQDERCALQRHGHAVSRERRRQGEMITEADPPGFPVILSKAEPGDGA